MITNPKTHLTRTDSGWTLIHAGMPLCRADSTLPECMESANRYGLFVPPEVWISQRGEFGTLAEAQATPNTADK